MDGGGWWWMMMDGGGYWWMVMDGDGWWWIVMNGDGGWWLVMSGCYFLLIKFIKDKLHKNLILKNIYIMNKIIIAPQLKNRIKFKLFNN